LALRDFERIPISGGLGFEGVSNVVDYGASKTTFDPDMPRGELVNPRTGLTTEGYVINRGTSFIMTMEFTDDGPQAFAFVTYSQSDDPQSPFHADQTRAFSEKRWREVLFTEEAIAADPDLAVEVVFGR
jgi:acyl-homoserine-lactone acylase